MISAMVSFSMDAVVSGRLQLCRLSKQEVQRFIVCNATLRRRRDEAERTQEDEFEII